MPLIFVCAKKPKINMAKPEEHIFFTNISRKAYKHIVQISINMNIIRAYFDELIESIKTKNLAKEKIASLKKELCIKYDAKRIPTDIEILLNAKKEDVPELKKYLITKPTRSISGVAPVAIMTRPEKCPHGKCTMCPGGLNSFFGDVPQSYTGHEPATMRGMRADYDSYLQVFNRLEQYIVLGQFPDKVELIIMGGTFPAVSKEYMENFVAGAFKAMNDFSKLFFSDEDFDMSEICPRFIDRRTESADISFSGYISEHAQNAAGVSEANMPPVTDRRSPADFDIIKFREFFLLPGDIYDKDRAKIIREKLLAIKGALNLEKEKRENMTAKIRCIGLTIETKPDWGFKEHGNELLKLGCTRVELGVQTIYDEVLHKAHRGHTIEDTKKSIRELRDLGFKLNFHMMPGLPSVTKEMDINCLKELFENPDYRPDMMKIYPCMVMPGTPLEMQWKKGEFTPLSTEMAADIISEAFRYVQPYCRVMRVQRDIPTKMAKDGVDRNNLRQIIDIKCKEKGIIQKDIRAREIGSRKLLSEPEFEIIKYDASDGKEFFISLVDKKQDALIGFVRLRFPFEFLRDEITPSSALIRELHVYGEAVGIGEKGGENSIQHKGYGIKLMKKAEEIAKQNGKDKIVVISGVGVREYFRRKLDYKLEEPYMVKWI